MQRVAALMLLLASVAFAANIKLYLKEGEYQLVREYQVLADRVRYYSIERADWEEIPLELVDLARTQKEAGAREASLNAELKAEEEENAAIRAERKEMRSVPDEPGAYLMDEGKVFALKQSDVAVVNDKKRSILKVLAPVPIVAGKNTVEMEGEAAQLRITNRAPEFYFRLASPERFAIVKITPKKNARIVQNVQIMPVSNELLIDMKQVATYKKQYQEDLYKIWPEEPLEPGEYALVEYTDGVLNVQVWDFGVGPAKK
jgi:hypothetical protein